MSTRLLTWTSCIMLAVGLVVMPSASQARPAAHSADPVASATSKPCVLLLHGLGKSSWSMAWLAHRLSDDYRVVNLDYASRRFSIQQLAAEALPDGLARCRQDGASPVHVVTHSMGGILLRQYTLQQEIPELGRVVMLGPPNQGSEVIDHLRALPGADWALGPAGIALATDGVPAKLGPVAFELGVIAGSRSVNPLLSLWLPGRDDGKVSLARTHVSGMQDHLVMPVSHPLLMWNDAVITQTRLFLETGRFSR